MHLSNLRIHHKLLVLVGIAVVSTIITAFAAYNFTKQDVIESRLEQIRTMVASHKLPLKRIANARANVSNSELVTSLTQYINDASLSESYYLFLIKEDGTITAHGQNPSWVGKNAATIFDHDAGKQFLANLANNTNTQGFYAHYALPRSSGGKPVAKTAFLTAINNTPYYLGASAYLDNLVPFYKTSGALLILLSLIALIATVVMSYFISGNIARPLNQLAEQMKTLASGQLNTALDSTQRHDEMGDIARAMVSVADKISENQRLKAIHEKVMFLETFDPVTRLLNRKAFGEAINREISRNDQHGLAIAVFKFDLLHEIAIELGNHERDRVLLNLASRMHDSLLADEQLGRLSEDTFSLLLPANADIEEITAKCHQLLGIIAQPITLSTTPIQITARAGISTYPQDGGYDAQLIGRAESTVTLAKRLEREILFYDGTSLNETEQGVELWQEMQKALDNDDFYLVFQPLYALDNNELVSAEVLLRWEHPEKGFISPAQFIPVAEQSGLISRLDAWVLEAVAKQLAYWSKQQMSLPRIAVNLSGISFLRPDFEQTLKDIFGRYKVPLQLLELELTEGVLIDDLDLISEQLRTIRATGAQVSIDDFGTGYSSLSRIKNLAIDTVKVDRSFIDGIDTSPQDRKIVEAIILMAHGLNLKVVAEGIETPEQLTVLRELDSDIAQGFFLSRPLKSTAFETLLEQDLVIETE